MSLYRCMKRGIVISMAALLCAGMHARASESEAEIQVEQLPTIIKRNLTAPKLELLQATEDMRVALESAIAALQSIRDAATADAALPVLRKLKETEQHYRSVCEKVVPNAATTERLYADGTLHYALRQLPQAKYNRLLQQEVAAACHGSVKLFLFITRQEDRFSEEEINTPLSADEVTALQMIESRILDKIAELKPTEAEAFIHALDQSEAWVKQLKSTAAGSLHLHALIQNKRENINKFYLRDFFGYGPVIDRIMRKRSSWMSELYNQEAHNRFFHWYDTFARDDASYKAKEALRKSTQNRIEAYKKRHNITEGTGMKVENPLPLPAGTKIEEYPAVIEQLMKEFYGEEHILPGLRSNSYQLYFAQKGYGVMVPVYVGETPLQDDKHYKPFNIDFIFFQLPSAK